MRERTKARLRALIWHFLIGCARGLGSAVGFTVLGAALVLALQRLVSSRLPVLGGFLARLARLVLERL